jgi:PAS domain S-box-containing protein
MDLIRTLFDTSDFPARWHCGHWSEFHGYTHIVSDLMIWGAYTAIPALLAFFFYRRRDRLAFPRIGWLFVAFIFACGTTHLLEAVIFWHPVYRVAGLMKLVTAGVSWLTVAALIPAIPRALTQPSSAQLSEALDARDFAEARARQDQHRFEGAFVHAPTGMALLNRAGACVSVNPALCQSIERTAESLIGRHIRELFVEQDQAGAGAGIPAVCDGTLQRYRGHKRILRDDGRTQWLDVAASAGQDQDPDALVVVHFVDITDEVWALEDLSRLNEELEARIGERTAELQRSNEELERFGYAAAHDLKAPLRAIANLTEWISEEQLAGNAERVAEYRALLDARVTRMKRLVDDLLGYARAGRADEMVGAIDLREAVQAAIEQVRPPDTFSLEVSADLPVITAARGPLEQIFANLIGNAVKHHGGDSGHIRITAAEAGDFWELTVADDGRGIPAEQRERVFEMFQTLRPRDEVEGSGLGLSLVRRSITIRGGSVSMEETPGGGCTVRVLWPKAPRLRSRARRRSQTHPGEVT